MTGRTRAKRFIKASLIIGIILLVLFNVFFYLIRRADVQTYLTKRAADLITSATGAPASVEMVDFRPRSILLRDVFIGDLNNDTLLFVHRLYLRPSLRGLLKRKIDIKSLELENAKLFIHREQNNSDFNYHAIFGRNAPSGDDSKPANYHFRLPVAEISDLDFHFLDEENKNEFRIAFRELYATKVNINAREKILSLGELNMGDANILVKKLFKTECDTSISRTGPPQMINNAGWDVAANSIKIGNSSFTYINENKTFGKGGMNYSDLHVSNINLDLENTSIVCDTIKSTIVSLSASEKCGFALKYMNAEAKVSTTEIECKSLNLVTDNSVIQDYLKFSYESFRDFNDFVNAVDMSGNFKNSRVSMHDINYFARNALVRLSHNTVWLTGTVRGTVANLKGRDLNLNLGKNTRFKGNFSFKGLPEFKETFITLDVERLQTTMEEMAVIYPYVKYPSNLETLGRVNFNGSFTGFANDFVARGNLATVIGDVRSDINLKIDPAANKSRYSGNFSLRNFNIGKFTGKENLFGEITLSTQVKGKGLKLQNVEATIDGVIASFNVRQHDYADVKINGDFKNKFFKGLLAVKDENLDLDFEGMVDLTDTVPLFQFVADLRKANLKELNLAGENIIISSSMKTDFSGLTPDKFNGYAGLFNTQIERYGKEYRLDTLVLNARPLEEGSKELIMKSDIAEASLTGHFAYKELSQALLDMVEYYFDPQNFQPTVLNDENFIFHLELKNTRNLTELIDTAFKNINEGYVNFAFNNKGNRLYLNSLINGLKYGKARLNDLSLKSLSEEGVLTFSALVDSVFYDDSLRLVLVNLQSTVANDSIFYSLKTQSDDCPNRMAINGSIDTDFKSLTMRLLPSSIHINGNEWQISRENRIYFDAKKLLIDDVIFFNGNSELELESYADSMGSSNLTAFFRKFQLSEVSNQMLSQSKFEMGGEINGSATVLNVLKNPKLTASLAVNGFRINQHAIGDITLDSDYKPGDEKVKIKFNLSGLQNDITASGSYNIGASDDNLDFSVNVSNLHLPHIEPFIQKEVTRIAGDVSGKLSLKGSLKDPEIKGSVTAKGVAAKVNFLNTTYRFDEEEINFSDNRIDFGDLRLLDEEENRAYAIGQITYPSFKEFNLDFDIKTDRFLFINTSQAPGQPFYGKLFASGLVFIKGPFNDVDFYISGRTRKDTKVFIDVAGAKDVSQYTFYRFVSDEDPKTGKKQYVTRMKGVTLNCDIEATPDAEVNVVMSYEDGDVINAKGEGNIKVVLNNYGELSISGDYRITDGNYVFSMQNVISKRFSMEKGSSIRWSGDPANATLDITGLYKLRASPYDLLADFVTTDAEIQKSKNRVQVLLYLYITGSLSQPNIVFDIKVPDADPTIRTYLESKFQELKYHPDEFNRQVVGLLVLNRFLPQKNSSNEPNVGSVVNTSVSEFLSNQLSVYLSDWISEFITDIQLDINYRNYQSEAEGVPSTPGQTEFENRQELQLALTKSFFNDRISVDVGGDFDFGSGNSQSTTNPDEKATNIAGDFEIQYSITPDGRIKVKAFRKGEYDIFEDRNKNKTGIGISYQKEFNTVKDFFSNIRRKREERKKKEEEEENKVKAAPPVNGN